MDLSDCFYNYHYYCKQAGTRYCCGGRNCRKNYQFPLSGTIFAFYCICTWAQNIGAGKRKSTEDTLLCSADYRRVWCNDINYHAVYCRTGSWLVHKVKVIVLGSQYIRAIYLIVWLCRCPFQFQWLLLLPVDIQKFLHP